MPTSGVYFAEVSYDVPDHASGEATINYMGFMTLIGDRFGDPVLDAGFSPLTVRAVECIDNTDCDDDDVCTRDEGIAGCRFFLLWAQTAMR